MNETNPMKYLKIEDNKGFFNEGDGNWIELDKLTKDHILSLLNKAITEDFKMDQFNSELIGNKAHLIIYKNLHHKFSELLENKRRFKDECDNLYKPSIEKYKAKVSDEEE